MKSKELIDIIEILKMQKENEAKYLPLAVSTLVEYLYFNLHKFKVKLLDEDDRSDFILWLYPKLESIILRFNNNRSSFYTYLQMMVKNYSLVFLKIKINKDFQQQACLFLEKDKLSKSINLEYKNTDVYLSCKEPSINKSIDSYEITEKQKELITRKILLLTCKSESFIDKSYLQKISKFLKLEYKYLENIVEKARLKNLKRKQKYNFLLERKNEYYIKSIRCKIEKENTSPTSIKYQNLVEEEELCKEKLKEYTKRIKSINMDLSNRELAEILGVSRGTVNNTVAKIKNGDYPIEYENLLC